MRDPKHCRKNRRGVTILELLVVVSIIAILVAMSFPVYKGLRGRAERAQSIQNLKSIYTALSSYLNEYRSWPQPPKDGLEQKFEYWKVALKPYGIDERHLKASAHIRMNKEEAERSGSYLIMEFEANDFTLPRRYGNQPWVLERGNFDGGGSWMIRANGRIEQEIAMFPVSGPPPASARGTGGR